MSSRRNRKRIRTAPTSSTAGAQRLNQRDVCGKFWVLWFIGLLRWSFARFLRSVGLAIKISYDGNPKTRIPNFCDRHSVRAYIHNIQFHNSTKHQDKTSDRVVEKKHKCHNQARPL
jgi:hypothetical protein